MPAIDELYVILTAQYAQAVEGFSATATAGEEMAAKVSAAAEEIDVQVDRMGMAAQRAATMADEAALQWQMDYARMAEATAAASAKMEAAQARAAEANDLVSKKMEANTTLMGRSATQWGMAAAGVAIAGGAMAKMAGDFESSTNKLVSSGGELKQNLEADRQGILQMAGDVGFSAMKLSEAMYTITGAGFKGAEGLKVLRAGAEGAKTENADLKTVVDAVTSTMIDYHLKADQAAMVTSKLVAATSSGKMTFQELASAFSQVGAVAAAAHIPLDDILGDLASMTVHGMSADQAAQNLGDTIRHLQNPTSVQTKEFAALGLSTMQVADSLSHNGLAGTLQMISERIKNFMPPGSNKVIMDLGNALGSLPPKVKDLGGRLIDGTITMKEYIKAAKDMDPISYKQAMQFASLAGETHQLGNAQVSGTTIMQTYSGALAKAMGDATGMRTTLMLTGENTDQTNSAIKRISGSTTEAGNHVKGWHDIQQTFNQKISEAKASLGALAITIGTQLLPPLGKAAEALGDAAKWLSKHPEIAKAAAVALGALAVGFTVAAVAVWAMNSALLANPITWIIIAIVATIAVLAFAINEFSKHWRQEWDAVKGAAAAVWHWMVDAWHSAVHGLEEGAKWVKTNVVDPVVRFFRDNFVHPFMDVLHTVEASWRGFWGFVNGLIQFALGFWKVVFGDIIAVLRRLFGPEIQEAKELWRADWLVIHSVVDWVHGKLQELAKAIHEHVIKPVMDHVHALEIWWNLKWQMISSGVQQAHNFVKSHVDSIINSALGPIRGAIHDVERVWDSAWNSVSNAVESAWRKISHFVDQILQKVDKVNHAISDFFSNPEKAGEMTAHLLGFEEGGQVPGPKGAPRLAIVHGGEFVVSNDMLAGRAGGVPALPASSDFGASGDNHFHLYIDGKELRDVVVKQAQQRRLRNGSTALV